MIEQVIEEQDIPEIRLDNKLQNNQIDREIYVPQHPIWTSMKDFGLDSTLSVGLNPIAMYFADKITDDFWKKGAMLAGIPILDKLLFFPRHIIKGFMNYYHVSKSERAKLDKYLIPELNKGLENVIADVLFQDTAYAALLYFGMEKFPNIPSSILGVVSCLAGIAIAGPAKVIYKEGVFLNESRLIKRAGFTSEKYWESRFKIPADYNYDKFLEDFANKFNMAFQGIANYQDTYIPNNFKEYNDRVAKIRLRQCEYLTTENYNQTLNIIQDPKTNLDIYFARAHKKRSEDKKNMHYPIWKEKFSYNIEGCKENITLDTLADSEQKRFVQKKVNNNFNETLRYTRTHFSDHTLSLNIDNLNGDCPFHFLEITVKDKESGLLEEVMKYVKSDCPTMPSDITYDLADIREKKYMRK